jgi:GGDEF domain-containing protein
MRSVLSPPGLQLAAAAALVGILTLRAVIALRAVRHDRALAQQALADVDRLLMAALDLRDVRDVGTAADRACRLASDLLHGDGALLYVEGPGRLLLAGRHGDHPTPIDGELGSDAAIEQALRLGAVQDGEPMLVPVTGEAGVIGVFAVARARRSLDALTAGMAQLFGGQCGAVLDRLHAVESLYDSATRDPITGVGNRHQASGLIAALRPGDGLLLIEVDDFESLRRGQGDVAANLVLGQVGLHLRNGTRNGDVIARYGDHQFVVALRDLKAPIDSVVERLLASWSAASMSRTITVGAALHLDGEAPLRTVERAEDALASARRRGGARAATAPDWAALVR